jgi:beta-lactamase class A
MIERRSFLKNSMAVAAVAGAPGSVVATNRRIDVGPRLAALEHGDARLGVCLLDTATGEMAGRRMDEHFAMCSTFKLAMVAACLRLSDRGQLRLDEIIPYGASDLLEWAPITEPNLGKGGLSIAALAQAAQERSDGTAANLLVRRLGGPAAVTAHFRAMGDTVTRLDRYEPMLGMVLSADLRDTTTPAAMAALVRRITTGDILAPASRQRLLGWMENTRTGMQRLRAGLPAEWRTGNKTGTGRAAGTTTKCNDIAITHPPGRSPIIIAAYYDSGEASERVEDRHQAVLADVGRIAADWASGFPEKG